MTRLRVMSMALAAGLLLSACGSDGGGLPSMTTAVRGDPVDPTSFLDALRQSFRDGSTAAVAFDVRGGMNLRGGGAVRYRPGTMDADLTMDDWQVKGGTIDIRTVGGTTYMRVPESQGLWVNLSKAPSGMAGADLADEADPRKSLDDLRAGVEQIRFTGEENIGGVRTRRFQVVTKARGAASAASPTVTEYWFDRHGRVVRRQSEVGQAGSMTFSWRKWGSPVRISRPANSRVITLARLEELRQKRLAEPAQ